MTEGNKILHHRRSIRLAGYDYSAEGGYFITIVTQGRVCLYGEVNDGVNQLNEFWKIVWDEWYRTAKLRPGVELMEDEFVVMPNHIHGIVWIEDVTGRGAACTAPLQVDNTELRLQIHCQPLYVHINPRLQNA